MRLRSSLLLVIIATAIPLVGFGVLVSALLVRHEQENFAAAVKDRNRAFMAAVDSQVRGYFAAMKGLATSQSLAEEDFAGFQRDARNVLATQPDWLNVLLVTAEGRHLMNVAVPQGAPMQQAPHDPETLARAIDTRQPVVGNVIERGPVIQRPGIPLRLPVLREGKPPYVLTAIIKPEAFQELVLRQGMPERWITGLVDARGRFIARMPTRPVGSLASAEFNEHSASAPEGWYYGRTVDGFASFTAHKRSDFTGWSVGLAIPEDVVMGGPRRAAWMMALGVFLSLALAIAVALRMGRRISQPIAQLAEAAPRIDTGLPVLPEESRIREIRELERALYSASVAVRERRELVERERELLRASDRAKEEFLAMLSHELRNPLAALTTSAHVLNRLPPGSDGFKHAQEVVQRQTAHMVRLVEDLLDMSHITLGKATLHFEPVDLGELAARVVETWRVGGRLARHDVHVATVPATIRGDRARLEQVISNLLHNAVKFTPEGKPITVSVRRAGGQAELEVRDEGRGIAPEDLVRMFDLFVQGKMDPSRNEGGLGVGLALVKRLVELQGGTIRAESGGEGQGALFVISFPAVAQARLGQAAD